MKTGDNSAPALSGKQQAHKTKLNERSTGSGSMEKRQIVIIGDSMVNIIQEDRLNKQHHVQIKRHDGATILDMKDFMKPAIRRKPDLVVIRAGTNDLADDQVNTSGTLAEFFKEVRNMSPESKIVMSSVITRQDKPGMPKKVKNLNKSINQVREKFNTRVMSNSNVGGECLSTKKLHLNQRGNSVFARKFLKLITDYYTVDKDNLRTYYGEQQYSVKFIRYVHRGGAGGLCQCLQLSDHSSYYTKRISKVAEFCQGDSLCIFKY